MGFGVGSWFCGTVHCALSLFAIISLKKRGLLALLVSILPIVVCLCLCSGVSFSWYNGHNAVPPFALESATPRSRIKHSNTEPPRYYRHPEARIGPPLSCGFAWQSVRHWWARFDVFLVTVVASILCYTGCIDFIGGLWVA